MDIQTWIIKFKMTINKMYTNNAFYNYTLWHIIKLLFCIIVNV